MIGKPRQKKKVRSHPNKFNEKEEKVRESEGLSGGTVNVSEVVREIVSLTASLEQSPKVSGTRDAWMAI